MMVQPLPKTYVQADEQDVLRVGNTRVMLDSVVASFEKGHSAESIRCQYPALTLEDVYGAIAYYLANREQVDEYLQRQAAQWTALRDAAKQEPSEVVQRLRALKRPRPS
jgi:uncharacterized protein (DUF433 family)